MMTSITINKKVYNFNEPVVINGVKHLITDDNGFVIHKETCKDSKSYKQIFSCDTLDKLVNAIEEMTRG